MGRSGWQRWVTRPQASRWRRFVVQAHLWLGLVLGVYVVVMSVTGSAVVLRPEFHLWLIPRTVPAVGERLTDDGLHAAIRRVYHPAEVQGVREPRLLDRPVYVTVRSDGETRERLFDPYAATDLGPAYPKILHVVEWLVDLHDNLLAGLYGRLVNGVAAIAFVALLVTGAVIWWPGRDRWRHSLLPDKPGRSLRFARRLHNALGFWSFALLFVWALTGIYFAFPDTFERAIDFFDPDPTDALRPGQELLATLVRLHFGRFGGLWGRLTWVVLGLLPAVLFVTGFITWWRQAANRRRFAADASPAAQAAADSAAPLAAIPGPPAAEPSP